MHLNSIKKGSKISLFALRALNTPHGVLLGVDFASVYTTACPDLAQVSVLALRKKVAVCTPTSDAMLDQGELWLDGKETKDEEWVMWDDGDLVSR